MTQRTVLGVGLVAILVALLAAVTLAAWPHRQRNEDFVPTEQAAHRALEAYLAAWQRGESVQPVPGTSPAVTGADGVQAGGRKLEAYAILGPVAADAPRCFAVRLTLGGPREERRERYVVIGLDPIWVMRYEDYEMILHWDHPMPAKTPAAKSK